MVAPVRKAQSKNCPLVNCPNETMPGKVLGGQSQNLVAYGLELREYFANLAWFKTVHHRVTLFCTSELARIRA